MADHFMSVNKGDLGMEDVANDGSASTAGDDIELRIETTCTKRDALRALKVFERWIRNGGLNGAGANLPAS